MNHSVPESFLTTIGDMTVCWSLLELHLQMLFGLLLGIEQRAQQIITSQLGFSRLRAVVISLYLEKYCMDSLFEQLKIILSKAKELEEERNRITHSIYGGGRDDGQILRIKMKANESKGFKIDTEEYNLSKMNQFIEDIKVTTQDLSNLFTDIAKRMRTK